jgi:hypothetical protein
MPFDPEQILMFFKVIPWQQIDPVNYQKLARGTRDVSAKAKS